MKHLIIRNVGPIESVDVELTRFTYILGPQSSGKSTIAKIFSTCSWIEKEISITLGTSSILVQDGWFVSQMENFHKMEGYFSEDSFVQYETECVLITYQKGKLDCKLKSDAIYGRKKICYIPSERNAVTLSELQGFEFGATNLRSFLFDWYNARTMFDSEHKTDILNLGVKYYYDKNEQKYKDRVEHVNGKTYRIPLASASSGLQSVTPLLIMLQFYTDEYFAQYANRTSFDLTDKERQLKNLLTDQLILNVLFPRFKLEERKELINKINELYRQHDPRLMELYVGYKTQLDKLTIPEKTIFVIEEPEQNLYPYTQMDLTRILSSLCQTERQHECFVTTHSPYIINYLNVLLRKKDESHIDASEISIFAVAGGYLQSLKAKDEQTGEFVIDTYDLSEPISDIFQEYNTLGNEEFIRK